MTIRRIVRTHTYKRVELITLSRLLRAIEQRPGAMPIDQWREAEPIDQMARRDWRNLNREVKDPGEFADTQVAYIEKGRPQPHTFSQIESAIELTTEVFKRYALALTDGIYVIDDPWWITDGKLTFTQPLFTPPGSNQ